MAIVTKTFNGGYLNSDDSHEYMGPSDLISGSGVRIQSQENNKQGLVVTLEGNRILSRELPQGTNICIKSQYVSSVNKTYIFTYNSTGRHRITEFDPVAGSFYEIYEELTDSNNVPILDFQEEELVKDVVLIDDEFLIFTIFPRDEVKMLSLRLVKDGTYSTFTAEYFDLGTYPPGDAINAYYTGYSEYFPALYPTNFLKGKLFQFRYRYKYRDGRYSDYSPISNRPTPTSELGDGGSVESQPIIGLDIREIPPHVAEVEVSARDGLNDWYTILTEPREWFTSLPLMVAHEIIRPPDPPVYVFRYDIPQALLGWGYYIPFFNAGLYPADNQLEHDLIASAIPRKTRAVSFVNGTNLLLANNLNGYPRAVLGSSQFSAEMRLTSNPIISPVDGDSLRVVDYRVNLIDAGTDATRYRIVFDGLPKIGDTLTGRFTEIPNPSPIEVSFTVTSTEENSITLTLQAWLNAVVAEFGGQVQDPHLITDEETNLPGLIFYLVYGEVDMNRFRVLLSGSINDLDIAVGSVKNGSSYSLIPAYYDYLGRPIPLPIKSEAEVKIPLPSSVGDMAASIAWSLTGPAPEDADKYTILISSNRAFQNVWDIVARVDPDSTPDLYHFDITSLYILNQERQGSPNGYDFVPGDMVHFICNVNPTDGSRSNYVDSPSRVVDIMSVEPITLDSSDPLYNNYPNHTKWILKARRPASDQFDPNLPVLIEIQRPKPSSGEDKIFYEIGLPMYDVVDGQHSVESGVIEAVDSFIKLRRVTLPWETINPNVDVIVESFHFSDNYVSNFYSFGRPRSYYDTPEGLWNHAEIRWSDIYVRSSNIKNQSRFFPENIFQVDHSYGGVQWLINRENRLICVQEDKVGYIPVYRTIIVDNAGQQQVATSERLLNGPEYYAGPNIGIGKDYAVPAFTFVNGSCYFVDPFEMLPVRAGLDGTRHIGYKYSGALKSKIRSTIDNKGYMKLVFDDRFNELLLIFPDETWTFDEKIDGWIPAKPYIPECGFSANDRLYTLKSGQVYIHDDEVNRNRFYGVNYPATLSFSITSPGVKTFRSIEQHSDDLMVTDEFGIATQLGQVSELNLEGDYEYNGEGVWTSNLLFDHNSPGGIPAGDLLKGRYIIFNLVRGNSQSAPVGHIDMVKFVVKDTYSTPNIT